SARSARMDAAEYRRHEAHPFAVRVQLRLESRGLHLRAAVLPLEPVVLPAHAGGRTGLSQESAGELVSAVRYGAGKRTGGGRLLLASREHTRRATRAGTVVPENHCLRRSTAGRHGATGRRLARPRPHHAAELD